jgi:site-specific DNA-methyltransferase (adenine-specific)
MLGDCLERMKEIPDGSVDMVLCDLPYGTTACKWDSVIPFEPLWAEYRRLTKPNAAVVLTAAQPFTSALVMSNAKGFRYHWVWMKNRATGFASAKKQPLRNTEDILVFYAAQPTYNPQGLVRLAQPKHRAPRQKKDDIYNGVGSLCLPSVQEFGNWPKTVLDIAVEPKPVHPTQKPVALLEYLIRTYTDEGQTVLDNTMGSGSTGVACINTGRSFIGIERDQSYYTIAASRIAGAQASQSLPLLEAAE